MPEKCHVIKCSNPVVAKGLCRTHYMQVKRHGEVIDTRPVDWGKREKHPAYKAWCGLRRYHRQDTCQEWLDDFWKFAEDVGDKPESAQAHRPDKAKPWSKDNFYWKEKRSTAKDRKTYMREWQKKSRDANPEYYMSQHLKKKYGVNYDWYSKAFSKQNGVCAICKKPETTEIRGKVISLAVDHCHTTGKARGLLCTQCNRGLGLFQDNSESLRSAIEYLAMYK